MSTIEEVHEDGNHGHSLELQGVVHHVMLSGPIGGEPGNSMDPNGMLLTLMFSGGAATMSLTDLKVLHRFLGEYLASRVSDEHREEKV